MVRDEEIRVKRSTAGTKGMDTRWKDSQFCYNKKGEICYNKTITNPEDEDDLSLSSSIVPLVNSSDTRNMSISNEKIKFFDFVFLKKSEKEKLISKYGQEETKDCIAFLDRYLTNNEEKRAQYKSHYKAIIHWVHAAVTNAKSGKQGRAWGKQDVSQKTIQENAKKTAALLEKSKAEKRERK